MDVGHFGVASQEEIHRKGADSAVGSFRQYLVVPSTASTRAWSSPLETPYHHLEGKLLINRQDSHVVPEGAQLRICFIGDSFVQGIGDPEYRGWVGRVLEATGGGITAFNLGIRRNTSEDVLRRCRQEILARSVPGADNRLVISCGSNDTLEEDGKIRVDPSDSLHNLAAILDQCRHSGIAPLVVGPPPVIDAGDDHLLRTSSLAGEMGTLCFSRGVPFIGTTLKLARDRVWIEEVRAGDGAHPGSGGYRRMADLILSDCWHRWIAHPCGQM
ncbi:GDSL-type esterase/lipase family protein [Spirillospora sp. NPDC000708]